MNVKSIPVFVYETLKSKRIQEEALGHSKKEEPAVLEGWVEMHKKTWPTLQKGKGSVKGFIIQVTARELDRLDDWEERYSRQIVHTDKGAAWTYIYK